jgi:hypothetical protein
VFLLKSFSPKSFFVPQVFHRQATLLRRLTLSSAASIIRA